MQSNADTPALPLVIGYGNPLRGDDGLGVVVAARLREILMPSQAVIVTIRQLTLDMAADVQAASQLILIDAATQGIPGTLTTQAITPDRSAMHTLQHHVTPSALLTATHVLYGNHPPATLVAVTGQQWDAGQDLSAVVRAAIPDVISRVLSLLGT